MVLLGKSRVGVSGWTFDGWKENFYPKGLSAKKTLSYASEKLTSLEINGTFYSLQKPSSFESWYKQTPDAFQFSVKGTQFITHIRRLKDVEQALAFFFGSGVLRLKEKLGPILWQFPPNMILKDDRFEHFLKLLPKDAESARRFMAPFRDTMRYPELIEDTGNFPIRYAFEMRHASFFVPEFTSLLKSHGAALVIAHGTKPELYSEEPCADFIYARMHGEGPKFKKGYPPKEIEAWALKCRKWLSEAKDVFCYFNSEAKEYAPKSALRLIEKLK